MRTSRRWGTTCTQLSLNSAATGHCHCWCRYSPSSPQSGCFPRTRRRSSRLTPFAVCTALLLSRSFVATLLSRHGSSASIYARTPKRVNRVRQWHRWQCCRGRSTSRIIDPTSAMSSRWEDSPLARRRSRRLLGHPERTLGNYVALNLTRSASDRLGRRSQENVLPRVNVVALAGGANE